MSYVHSLNASKYKASLNETVVFTGRFSFDGQGIPNVVIRLTRCPHGEWLAWAVGPEVVTDSDGGYKIELRMDTPDSMDQVATVGLWDFRATHLISEEGGGGGGQISNLVTIEITAATNIAGIALLAVPAIILGYWAFKRKR